MGSKSIQETVVRNPMPMEQCHIVGVRGADGNIDIVKCEHDKSLVGKTLTRSEWNAIPTFEVKKGKPRRAILQDVSTITTSVQTDS